jgi:hypothetical protein
MCDNDARFSMMDTDGALQSRCESYRRESKYEYCDAPTGVLRADRNTKLA